MNRESPSGASAKSNAVDGCLNLIHVKFAMTHMETLEVMKHYNTLGRVISI